MEILRRLTAALLVLVMVFTILPLPALAEETKPVTIPEETAPAGEVALDVPETIETEAVETVPETAPATEPAEPTPEATVPEETWEIGDIEVVETAETLGADGKILASGKCSDTISWVLDGDYVLTISGVGEMEDNWQYYIKDWDNKILSVIIEPGVTNINDGAFWYCNHMTSITIPDTVTSIGKKAFEYCRDLTTVDIPNSVTSIGEIAFSNSGLTSIIIPSNVAIIGDGAFSGSDLSSITIMDGVTSIGSNAFASTDLTNVTIPSSVKTIGEKAFYQCLQLTDVSIQEGVENLGAWAFSYCNALETVTIPGSIKEIGTNAFYSCHKLNSVTIGDGVNRICDSAFSCCSALPGITIPDSVTYIGNSAFLSCSNLQEITIPDSVVYIGSNVFGYCGELASVKLSKNLAYLGKEAFYRCKKLTNVEIPDSITSLSEGLFKECTGLTSVTIPESVSEIGAYAFYMCESLPEITIPENVNSIGETAFSQCKSLTAITIPENVTILNKSLLSGCEKLVNLDFPDDVSAIGDSAFSGCKSLPNITIPDSVTYIGQGAFASCNSFTEITIPENVSSIGTGAFDSCKNLSSVIILDGVTYIGSQAFRCCEKLTYISMPDSITYIGHRAFYECKNLPEVTIPEGVTYLYALTFYRCESLTSIIIPANVIEISYEVFDRCDNLTTVTMGDKIEAIGENAFYRTNVQDIYYAGTEEQFWEIAFTKIDRERFKMFDDHGRIHYNTPMSAVDVYHLEVEPKAGEHVVSRGEEIHLAISLYRNNKQITDWSHPNVTMKYTDIVDDTEWSSEDGRWILTLKGLKEGRELLTFSHSSGKYAKVWVRVTPVPVWEYLDNSKIRINGSGSAYAYYQGDPNEIFAYTLNGKSNSVTSNDKGVIRIPLGTFKAGGTYENTVQFLKVGNKGLSPAIGFKPTVIATQLEYSHEFQVSLDAGVGVAIGEGLGVKLGTFKAMATLGQLGTGAGLGGAITVIDTYAGGSRTLEVMDQTALDAYGSFDSGISGETKVVELDILSSSTKIKANGTGIYGLRIRNYSEENQNAQKAIATFFLGEALKEKSNNVYLRNFQNWLAEKLYTQSTVDVIDGRGAAVSGEFEAGGANLTIGNLPLITGLKSDLEATASISEKSYGNGDSEFSTSITADVDMDLASLNMFNGVVGADYLGKDITVKVAKETGKKSLETTSLSSEVMEAANIVKGEHFTADYNQFVFEEDSLDELMQNAKSVDDYINGNRIAANNADMEDIATVLSGSEVPVEYANLEKTHFLTTNPLEFGVTIGVGVDFGLTASYMQSVEHQKAGGFVKEDEILINSESKDYSAEMDKKLLTLDEWLAQPFVSLVEEVKEFFEKIAGTIQEGIKTAWGWIEGKADSLSDWMVSLMAASNEDAWASSQEIGIKGDQVNFALARQVSNVNEAYATRSATTIGRPFIVNVTDGTTGEQIKDFSTEPLTFTICYAGEDLMAANYNAETQVISMYRYSDDGDYFEHIGGIHDAEEKTVTATITKPGQYILAAEVMEEEEPGEDTHNYQLGDVNHDTKINAKDATLILQKSVGVLKPTAKFCEDCAEVSGDGKLNAKDSTLILQFSVGLKTEFPAQSK